MGQTVTVTRTYTLSSKEYYKSAGSHSGQRGGGQPRRFLSEPDVESQAPWLPEVRSQLLDLMQLGENWDGHDAHRINLLAAHGCLTLLASPDWAQVPRPHVSGTPDGGVTCQWASDAVEIEVEISSTGRIETYLADLVSGAEYEGALGTEPDGLSKWIWRLRHH